MLCMPSAPQVGNEFACCCSKILETVLASANVSLNVDVIARDDNAAVYNYCKKQEHQDLQGSSDAFVLREMQRVENWLHFNCYFVVVSSWWLSPHVESQQGRIT